MLQIIMMKRKGLMKYLFNYFTSQVRLKMGSMG